MLSSAPPFDAPDRETPALTVAVLTERPLLLAVPEEHPLARGEFADIADLDGHRWIAGAPTDGDCVRGTRPGLAERPEIAQTARDRLARLRLVAVVLGTTTILAPVAPPGVRVPPVRGGPLESRRLLIARMPGRADPVVNRVAVALRAAAVG